MNVVALACVVLIGAMLPDAAFAQVTNVGFSGNGTSSTGGAASAGGVMILNGQNGNPLYGTGTFAYQGGTYHFRLRITEVEPKPNGAGNTYGGSISIVVPGTIVVSATGTWDPNNPGTLAMTGSVTTPGGSGGANVHSTFTIP